MSHQEVIQVKTEMTHRIREIKRSPGFVKGSCHFKITRETRDEAGNILVSGFHTVTWQTKD